MATLNMAHHQLPIRYKKSKNCNMPLGTYLSHVAIFGLSLKNVCLPIVKCLLTFDVQFSTDFSRQIYPVHQVLFARAFFSALVCFRDVSDL